MPVENPTILLALATFAGALIGAGAQFYIHRLDVWREQESLRRALISELRSQPSFDDDRWESLPDSEEPKAMVSNSVYAENSGNIGMLSPDEAEEVVRYHSALEAFVTFSEGLQDVPDDHEVWDEVANLREELEGQRTDAIEELKGNTGGLFSWLSP